MWNTEKVRELQQAIRVIFWDRRRAEKIYPDGIYGPETSGAVRILQQMEGLPETGEVDHDTWDAAINGYLTVLEGQRMEALPIFPNASFQLQRGAGGLMVGLVQGILQKIAEVYGNIPSPSLTMQYDLHTEQAVAAFQQKVHLPVTGHLDRTTWNILSILYDISV